LTLPLIVLCGPTAVGKTATALSLARRLDCEVVSVDSRQVYAGMAIGSGAPYAMELRKVKHHLIGEVPPDQRLTAGEYARMALERIGEIESRGRGVLIVGGSGLYLRALLDGLSPAPPADPAIREELSHEIERLGVEPLLDELHRVDPEYATHVGHRDRKRLVRALEVQRLTGRPFSAWHQTTSGGIDQPPRRVMRFGLNRPRPELHRMIEARVAAMFAKGWVVEVEDLARQYGGIEKIPEPVAEAVGYRSIIAYLIGTTTLQDAGQRALFATRQFAKRQMTWFRADPRIVWLEGSGPEAPVRWADLILDAINNNSSDHARESH